MINRSVLKSLALVVGTCILIGSAGCDSPEEATANADATATVDATEGGDSGMTSQEPGDGAIAAIDAFIAENPVNTSRNRWKTELTRLAGAQSIRDTV